MVLSWVDIVRVGHDKWKQTGNSHGHVINIPEALTDVVQLGSVHTSTEVSIAWLKRFLVLKLGSFDVNVLGLDNLVPLTLPH